MNLIKSSVALALFNVVLSMSVTAQDDVNTVAKPLTQNVLPISTDLSEPNKQALMMKLAQIKHFSADFVQQVFDESGNELSQGNGLLSVSKPNLVNWETQLPDESLIVSDGNDLWFYNPFVEQVSVYPLANAIANTPILLITNNDKDLWQQYNVKMINDTTYAINAKDENARVKTLELNFANNAETPELTGFTILDATGQLSVIKLKNINFTAMPDQQLFMFEVPEGVYVDDQR